MNSESPLVPQGSFLEQKNKGRARVRIAVFVVLAIHCVGVMALLMQGCKKPATDEQAITTATNTPAPPVFIEPTNQIVTAPETNISYPSPLPGASDSNISTVPVIPVQEPVVPPTTPSGIPSTVTEHKIVRGDTFAKLAKTYGVSTKAIEDANPGVQSSRLKLGATVRIPAPAPASTAGTEGASLASSAGSSTAPAGLTYKVKSGDNLIKIAKAHGVTPKEIRTANNMKTDRIRVGQTLKIPGKTAGAEASKTTPSP